jgi:putative sterol carrier protein
MARFASPEWIDELDRAMSADPALQRVRVDVSLVVEQTVTGGPDGDSVWHVVVDDGRVRVHRGHAAEPDVTFSQTYATAAAIARGELSAQTAFMVGELTVGGDVSLLMTHQDTFDGVEDVFEAVRAGTEF